MNPSNDFQLVKGVFNTDDAREVLLHLLQQKIKFHCNRQFELEERFGIVDEYSKKRVLELKEDKREVMELVRQAALMGKNLHIRCDIQIDLVDTTPNLHQGKWEEMHANKTI
ncbi:MAG TPA: hypothetical protein PKA70_22570 [Saprospiraceae bacterium]|nr:hypothetical protein [Saprospiraceae bacterium]